MEQFWAETLLLLGGTSPQEKRDHADHWERLSEAFMGLDWSDRKREWPKRLVERFRALAPALRAVAAEEEREG